MACRHCHTGNEPRVAANGMRMHDVGPERYYCEDQTPPSYDRLSSEEKKRLFFLAGLASDIRMDHAVPLYRALDYVREVLQNGEITPETDRKTAIEYTLQKFGHTCDRTCSEAKKVE
jgi:hypothetical protein